MPKITIDNVAVEVPQGATVLQAARTLGIEIPTLCQMDGCKPETSCLVCVVRINGATRLSPSCGTVARDGMVIESETKDVRAARRMALELLLADHAGDCFAPCHIICPARLEIPEMLRLVREGDYRRAVKVVKESLALPAVLGRICPQLCEKGCRRGQLDDPVTINSIERAVADADLASDDPYLPECQPASGKRVAIVGSGPAGLAAAWYLLQKGHAAVVFDQHQQPGGNLRTMVGEERLPHDVLDSEIGLIRKLGAEFRMGVTIGPDGTALSQLQSEFDAVLIAVGEFDAKKAEALGLAKGPQGVKIDPTTMMSSIKGVFAAGAALRAHKHTVRSVADGRDAASLIDMYISGGNMETLPALFSSRMGRLNEQEMSTFMANANEAPRAQPAGDGASRVTFDAMKAKEQAERCQNCDCSSLEGCTLRRYAVMLGADAGKYKVQRKPFERIVAGANVIYEPGKCIVCGLCVQITERAREPLGLAFIGRGFDVRVDVPFDRTIDEGLQKVAAECIAACPTGALDWADRRPRQGALSLPVLKTR